MGRLKIHRSGVSTAALAALTVSLVGCAAPETRSGGAPAASPPTEFNVRATTQLRQEPPPASLGAVERYAWQTVIQLGEAYEKGDVDGFLARVSRGFYRGYPALETSLQALVRETSNRSAVVAVREVSLDGDRVSVRAQWERGLVRRDGTVQTKAGETTFLFLKSDTSLRLLDFRGDVPFGIEGLPGQP